VCAGELLPQLAVETFLQAAALQLDAINSLANATFRETGSAAQRSAAQHAT
jgi:hypothetical protein